MDDDPDLQKLIRQYFQMEGFLLRAALKRDDIVLALRKPPTPDLIVLDVNLPDINGFDVLTRMRQHPVLKDIPVVMLTAESSRAAVLKGLRGGADGYVTKPFEADTLVTAVKTVLGLSAPAKKKEDGADWRASPCCLPPPARRRPSAHSSPRRTCPGEVNLRPESMVRGHPGA